MTDPAPADSSSSIQNEAEDQKDSSATDNNKNQDKSTASTTTTSSVEPPVTKKRVAGRQLTKDDENDPEGTGSEEPVTVGTIPKASEEVLKTRRIAKIARNKDGTVDWSKKKTANPFAAVNLVAPTSNDKKEDDKDTTTTTTQAKSPIFGVNAPFSGFDAVKNRGSGFGTSSASSGGFGSAGFGTGFGGFATSSTTSTPFAGFGSTTAATTTTSSVFGGAAKSGPSTGESTTKEALEETDGTKSQSTFNFSFAPLPKQQQQSQSTAGDNSTEPLGESAAAGASTEPTTTTTSQNTLLPTDYQPQSGEENEILLLEVKCKTHRWGPASGNSTADSNHESSTTTSLVSAAVPPTESSLSSSSSSKPNPNTEESDQKPNTTDKPEGSSSEKDATTATKTETKGSKPNAESTSHPSSAPTTTKSDMAWHEVGIGPLRILQSNETTNDNNATKKPSVRLVQRRRINTASATKVLINQQLFAESTIAKPSDRHVKFSTPAGGGGGEATANGGSGATTLLFRFGKAQEATNVASLLEQEIAKAPSRFGEEESTDKTTLPADEKKDDTKEES